MKSSGGGAAPVWIELTDAKGAAGMLQLAAPGVMNDAAELPPLPPDGITKGVPSASITSIRRR